MGKMLAYGPNALIGADRYGGLYANAGLNLRSLFANGEGGALYVPQPPYLFTTSAGETAIAADGEAFGLQLDSKTGTITAAGAGNHATQATSASRPVYKTLGARHWGNYNGSSHFLDTGLSRIGSTGLFCANTETFCVAGAFRSSTAGTTKRLLARAGTTTANMTFMVSIGSTNTFSVLARGAATTIGPANVVDGAWHVFVLDWDGAALTYMFDSATTASASVGTAAEETSERILIGARTTAAPTNFFGGDLGTILIRDSSLSLTRRQALIRTLARSYGVTLA